ncbi:hypothetical protein BP6252_00349 [Coleophoma cylindrospora]|uniref:Zn(2)-C6 fungal-type domain-containing protein n=1 Tax=Coleophoma cylindrospora TaxID=1849047 RepID=A0A3D8SPU5_9HELO|nr:hypothetical protein BP6252_00349 [Coleophoma cylindrospora]
MSNRDSSETASKPKHNRSRGGCTRCRSRRQKCDEKRPACARCQENGSADACSYTVNLQWGGRNFSSYAKNSDIKKYETEPGNFVYVASSSKSVSPPPPAFKRASSTASASSRVLLSPVRSIDPSVLTKPMERLLLHHYANEAVKITSCHPQIQAEFCSFLLPMAVEYPPLLSALMALSAIHRKSLYAEPADQNSIIAFKTSSITKLRSELSLPNKSNSRMKNAVLATALTLCMCEIHSGGDQPRSWRLHLEGAKALIGPQTQTNINDPTGENSLLARWYVSIEALAALTAKGLHAGQLSSESSVEEVAKETGEVYLDDYFGFSTDLTQTFKEIGAAAWERKRMNEASAHMSLSEQDLEDEANILESSVWAMILRDQASPPKFFPGIAERLSPEVIQEFYLCNEAYQHAALIHILRRVKEIPKTDDSIQKSVKRVLECSKGIKPRAGLSPYIVLTMPLFTAGVEALEEDRESFRSLLSGLHDYLKLRNIQRSIDFLELHWKTQDDPDLVSSQGEFDLFVLPQDVSTNQVAEDGENCDFIPY